eukprot:331939-Pleurochrysis_carterae.AAC.2
MAFRRRTGPRAVPSIVLFVSTFAWRLHDRWAAAAAAARVRAPLPPASRGALAPTAYPSTLR